MLTDRFATMDQTGNQSPLEFRTSRVLAGALAAWWAISAILYAPWLPYHPMHFDSTSIRYSNVRITAWFFGPAIASYVFILLEWAIRMSVKHPDLVNIRQKDAFLRLNGAQRAPILRELYEMYHLIVLASYSGCLLVQIALFRSASGVSRVASWSLFAAVLTAVSVALVAQRSYRRVDALLRPFA